MRPRFVRKIRKLTVQVREKTVLRLTECISGEFKPDVIQFVDPIWLCAQ